MLTSSLDILRPENLGITSNRETAIANLNDWAAESGTSGNRLDLNAEAEKQLAALLPREQIKLIKTKRFVRRDGAHVRNCLLYKAVMDFVTRSARDDLERAVRLFDYTVRNIAREDTDEEKIPLPPYANVLFGRGTAKDRAWFFANLLRQLRIDSVILTPAATGGDAGEAEENERTWLVGVLIDEDDDQSMYLFDPKLGWPVPSAQDDGKSSRVGIPATLAEVLADDSLLRKLDLDGEHPYPLKAEQLKSLRVEVIGNTGYWAPRMRQLHAALSGDRSTIIYDSLEDSEEFGDGAISRAADFGKAYWNRGDIAVWAYPEQQIIGYGNLTDEQIRIVTARQLVFNAPYNREFDEQARQVRFGLPEAIHMKTRTVQMLGDYGGAIKSYLQVRIAGSFPAVFQIDPKMKALHTAAAEDAVFWGALCQFEQGEFLAAAEGCSVYFRNPVHQGRWKYANGLLLGISLADGGEWKSAIQVLKQIPEESPEYKNALLLVRRWESSLGESGAGKKPAEKD